MPRFVRPSRVARIPARLPTNPATNLASLVAGVARRVEAVRAAVPVHRLPRGPLRCLQTLAEAVRSHHASLSDQDAAALRAHVASWIHDAATRTDPATAVPAVIKNKLAQVCARLAGAEYPARWPSFFADLLQLAANAGDGGLDALVRVLDAVDDEVISSGDTQHAGQGAGVRDGNSRGGGADHEVPTREGPCERNPGCSRGSSTPSAPSSRRGWIERRGARGGAAEAAAG